MLKLNRYNDVHVFQTKELNIIKLDQNIGIAVLSIILMLINQWTVRKGTFISKNVLCCKKKTVNKSRKAATVCYIINSIQYIHDYVKMNQCSSKTNANLMLYIWHLATKRDSDFSKIANTAFII